MPTAKQTKNMQLDLNGRLITAYDSTKITQSDKERSVVANFKKLRNLAYTDYGITPVPGMTKVNTTALTSNPKIRNMFHFRKAQPLESHVLVQAYNSTETQSKVFTNDTAIPNQGDFNSTALYTDASTAGLGRFSSAPLSHVCYCNGESTMVWGGDETKIAGFLVYDKTAGTFYYDYTDQVRNTLTDALNVATMKQDSSGSVFLFVGGVLPISGIKFYVGTANTAAGTLTVEYWDGSAWQQTTNLSDGTAVGGVPLAQTGFVTFDTTETISRHVANLGIMGHWFRVEITNCDNTAKVSQVTLKEPFQKLQDLWDSIPRSLSNVWHYDAGRYIDVTTNVFKDEYYYNTVDGGDTSTYIELGGFTTSERLYIGSIERLQGFHVKFLPIIGGTAHHNTTAATTITVSYWDGLAWQALTVTDGTKIGAISFTQAGNVRWDARAENVEFRKSFNETPSAFYYEIKFNTVLSAKVDIYNITGIPAQKPLNNYKFSLYAKNRLLLFSDQSGNRNAMITSNLNTLNVFNGKDTGDPVFFGRENISLEGAIELFTKFDRNLQSIIVVYQKNTTYLLFGDDPESWVAPAMPVSSEVGLSAPLTLKASPIGFEFSPFQGRSVAIWLHSTNVYMFDPIGGVIPIGNDIIDLFDQKNSYSINLDAIEKAFAVWVIQDGEYYYILSLPTGTSTTCDYEVVFDFRRQKWFEIDRLSGKYLQCATEVRDVYGTIFTYGCEDNGYIQRLFNGTDFDGNNIECEYQTGDMALAGNNTLYVTRISAIQIPQVAKTVTTNTITCTHYADGETTGNSFVLTPVKSGRRLAIPSMTHGTNLNEGVFHSISHKLITNDETRGFQPLYENIKYEIVREALYNN